MLPSFSGSGNSDCGVEWAGVAHGTCALGRKQQDGGVPGPLKDPAPLLGSPALACGNRSSVTEDGWVGDAADLVMGEEITPVRSNRIR
jgi:hypothetical protein